MCEIAQQDTEKNNKNNTTANNVHSHVNTKKMSN